MDPTGAELEAIARHEAPLQEALRWTGLLDAAVTALREQTGEFTLVREVVHIPSEAWLAAAAAARVPVDKKEPRPLTPLELGQVGSLRRVARMLCGLPPSEGPAGPEGQSKETPRC